MTLADNELFSEGSTLSSEIRIVCKRNRVGTIAAVSGAPLLPRGCPLAWDEAAGFWVPYTQGSDAAIYTLTTGDGGTDDGQFVIVVNGVATVADFDVTAAALQAAMRANLAAAGYGAAAVTAVATAEDNLGVSGAVVTLTFAESLGAPEVELHSAGLLDGDVPEPENLVLAASDPGTALNGANRIRGFVYDALGVQTNATKEVQAVVMLEGEIHRDDVNTATIRAALLGSPSEGELDTALKDPELRALGLHVRGLAGVH